jgi:hypothetical protein
MYVETMSLEKLGIKCKLSDIVIEMIHSEV